MQDKFVGDVGDFGKYGLLSHIYAQSQGNFSIGVNWYKNTKEKKKEKNHGKFVNYLKAEYKYQRKYQECFPELYEKLKQLVETDNRNLHKVEISQILPENTIFYSEDVPFSSPFYLDREKERIKWFKRSLEHLKKADIIYVDPDIGIEKDTVRKTRIDAVNYVFWDEIQKYYEEEHSVIVYNHRDHSAVSEYNERLLKVNGLFEEKIDVRVLRFLRFALRDYIFLIQPTHKNIIDTTFKSLTKKPYNFLFEEYNP